MARQSENSWNWDTYYSSKEKNLQQELKRTKSCSHELLKVNHQSSHPEETPHTRERDKIKQTEASNESKTKPRNFRKQAPHSNTSQKQWESSVKLQQLLWTMTPTQRSGKLLLYKNARQKNIKVKSDMKLWLREKENKEQNNIP